MGLASIAAGVAIFFLGVMNPAQAFEWETRRFDGRDYVSVQQILGFYGLSNSDPESEKSAPGSLSFRRETREVTINGLKHVLAFPIIERDGNLWVSRLDLSRMIEPALRPAFVQGIYPPETVVLDAGHGGQDKGAIGPYQMEKNFALDLTRRVRDELRRAGVDVFLTRNSDTFIDLAVRAEMAARKKNAIFVSLHFNAAPNRAAQGFEIYSITPRGAPSTQADELLARDMVQEFGNAHELESSVLANAIYHAMHGRLQMMDRGIKRARFAVLRLARMPAVLVEAGFLSNPVDARRIASPEWRTICAKAIAEGILAYIHLAESKVPPPLVAQYRTGAETLPTVSPVPEPPRPAVSLRGLPEEPAGEPAGNSSQKKTAAP